LADTIGNLSNRCLSFINKNYEGIIAPEGAKCDPAVAESISVAYEEYCKQLNQGLAKVALAAVIDLGRKLNVYFQEQAPWKVRKEDPVKAHGSLYSVSIGIKAIALMLTPYVPGISQKMWNQLGLSSPIEHEALEEAINLSFPAGHKISPDVSPIVAKIEDTFIAAQKEALQARIKK
jgi:methionyl-tRNA synthetase